MPDQHGSPQPDTPPRTLNEDWLAVIVGLTLLALVLLGAIPGSVVP
ncbi:Uncharacterised protein [Mycolicibacterium aurum]|uniref:Uncharacterized protein n=1 Tax=Mycolicibacterium aurum TaxID=1791 RepID=A0A3S4RID9_MYCAU|nr:hypothetical protein [Mycolicibacterium aurum]VEG51194.1 Uncharacterised protein [Mycolicibacterium aurum]